MKKLTYLLTLTLLYVVNCNYAHSQVVESDLLNPKNDLSSSENKDSLEEDEGHSVFHSILLYIPNRLFDILDIVKAKVRVGPGLSVGAQVTRPVSAFVGAHSDIFIGLPGPREDRTIPLPIGAEAVAGGSLSLLDGVNNTSTNREKESRKNSSTEISAEFQALLIGLEIGIDPVELLDAITGIFFIDIRDDDL